MISDLLFFTVLVLLTFEPVLLSICHMPQTLPSVRDKKRSSYFKAGSCTKLIFNMTVAFFQTSENNRVDMRLEMWTETTQGSLNKTSIVIKRREWIQEIFKEWKGLYLETNWMWDDQLIAWVKMGDGEDMRSVLVILCLRHQWGVNLSYEIFKCEVYKKTMGFG